MLLLLWKRALLLAAAALLGLYSLFTATTADSLHSLHALPLDLSALGRDAPRVAILEPTSYHSGGSLLWALYGWWRLAARWRTSSLHLDRRRPAASSPVPTATPLQLSIHRYTHS